MALKLSKMLPGDKKTCTHCNAGMVSGRCWKDATGRCFCCPGCGVEHAKALQPQNTRHIVERMDEAAERAAYWSHPDRKNPRSGYTPCACRDCMETSISNDSRRPAFCSACKDAGCEIDTECRVATEDSGYEVTPGGSERRPGPITPRVLHGDTFKRKIGACMTPGCAKIDKHAGDHTPRKNPDVDEPQEEDLVTEDHREFWQSGKKVLTVDRDASETEMWSAIERRMEADGVFPNVWFLSDHGNYHRMIKPRENGMGGHEYGTPSGSASLTRVKLDRGGYDSRGSYWGVGEPLWTLVSDDSQHFIRASDRDEAAAEFKKKFPGLRLARANPHHGYGDDEETPAEQERMRRLRAISDAAMAQGGARSNPNVVTSMPAVRIPAKVPGGRHPVQMIPRQNPVSSSGDYFITTRGDKVVGRAKSLEEAKQVVSEVAHRGKMKWKKSGAKQPDGSTVWSWDTDDADVKITCLPA